MYKDDSFDDILKDIQIVDELKIIVTKLKTEKNVDFINIDIN